MFGRCKLRVWLHQIYNSGTTLTAVAIEERGLFLVLIFSAVAFERIAVARVNFDANKSTDEAHPPRFHPRPRAPKSKNYLPCCGMVPKERRRRRGWFDFPANFQRATRIGHASFARKGKLRPPEAHTHTHIRIYMYAPENNKGMRESIKQKERRHRWLVSATAHSTLANAAQREPLRVVFQIISSLKPLKKYHCLTFLNRQAHWKSSQLVWSSMIVCFALLR